MRVKFPEGSGGPWLVPGVGPVLDGQEFDWPDDEPPVAGTVPVEDGSSTDEAPPAEDDPGETGEGQPAAKSRARSKE